MEAHGISTRFLARNTRLFGWRLGHCQNFLFFSLSGSKVCSRRRYSQPSLCGCTMRDELHGLIDQRKHSKRQVSPESDSEMRSVEESFLGTGLAHPARTNGTRT